MLAALVALGAVCSCGRYGFDVAGSDAGAELGVDADEGPGADGSTATRETWTFGEVSWATVRDVSADTWMCEGVEAENNWGLSDELEGGTGCTGLLRFDLGSLPAGAVVLEASLELWPLLVPADDGRVEVHRMLEEWVEGTGRGEPGESNYVHRLPGVEWTTRGGTPPGSAETVPLHEFHPARFEAQVIPLPAAVVQGWLDEPDSNHGLGFYGSGYGYTDEVHPHFFSSDAPEAEMRPVLTITFERS